MAKVRFLANCKLIVKSLQDDSEKEELFRANWYYDAHKLVVCHDQERDWADIFLCDGRIIEGVQMDIIENHGCPVERIEAEVAEEDVAVELDAAIDEAIDDDIATIENEVEYSEFDYMPEDSDLD
jgi:hypothetical protein